MAIVQSLMALVMFLAFCMVDGEAAPTAIKIIGVCIVCLFATMMVGGGRREI